MKLKAFKTIVWIGEEAFMWAITNFYRTPTLFYSHTRTELKMKSVKGAVILEKWLSSWKQDKKDSLLHLWS